MQIDCCHLMITTSDLDAARGFYIGALGLPVIEDHPTMFAVRAGGVRFSVMKGGTRMEEEPECYPNVMLMLRTDSLDATVPALREQGVRFVDEISNAPGFMRHIAMLDPDNNLLVLAQYERDPLAAV